MTLRQGAAVALLFSDDSLDPTITRCSNELCETEQTTRSCPVVRPMHQIDSWATCGTSRRSARSRHSITLALAVLGVVTIPGRIIEPAIAASIVWVALENLLRRDAPSQRWLVSFVFGLVHGFGFASAVEPLALPPARLALALLGFNLGVEAGQALVVVLLLPLLLWMRGKPWEPRVVRAASLGVAAVGLAWLVARLFSAS